MNSYISAYRSNNEVHVWERTPDGDKVLVKYPTPYYFYVPDKAGEYTSVYGKPLRREDFDSYESFDRKRKMYQQRGILLYESDIQPLLKVLCNNYADRPAPKLNYTLYDIEVDYNPTDGFSSVENPYAPINAVALHHQWTGESIVIAVPPPSYQANKAAWDKEIDELRKTPKFKLTLVNTERELLDLFLSEIQDSDVLSGWNSDTFDAPYITKRIEMVFGRARTQQLCFPGAPVPTWRQFEVYGKMRDTVDFHGRMSLDYMLLFKKFEASERPSFSLEAISNEVVPELPKLEYEGTLYELYHKNFPHFLRYNYRDTEVLAGFERKLGYLEVANMLYHMSCGLSSHIFGTIRLADLAITLFCHNTRNMIVPDRDETKPDGSISGAMVLVPQMGMHDWLGSVDVTSLYPSAIRTINISPETLIGQMRGMLSDDDRMKHSAWQAIFEQTDRMITLDYDAMCAEDRVGSETMTGAEWFEVLLERGWAISGYGTIYTQNFPGIIPAILTDWFSKRKKYKDMKDDCKKLAIKLKNEGADQSAIDEQIQLSEYYDRLQYIFKIKLNSLYGALTNYTFRYFDLRLGESTTGTGRCVLDHMCSIIAKTLDGNYSFISDSIIYGDSVAGDTKIRLQDGSIVNIESLYTSTDRIIGTKEYCNTNNLSALTYDQSTNQSCYKPIKYVMRHNVTKKMYRVWISNTNYVDVTEDHSLIGYANTVQRKHNNGSPLIEVKPQELGGNVRSLIYLKRVPQSNVTSYNFNEHVYELMGLIVGDGSMSRRSSGIELSLGNRDKDEIITKTIRPLISIGLVTSVYHCPNGHDVRLCGTAIWDLLYDHLYTNGSKNIPEWLQFETQDNIASFLRGYFTADGTVTGSTVRLTSTNLDFIKSVRELLFKLGISSNYFTESIENSFNGVGSGTHSVNLIVKGRESFNRVGFILDRKNCKIPCNGKSSNYQSRYDFSVTKVVKVEEIQYSGYVYDIEVGDTHVFFANDILVHNTDSCYFKTHAGTVSAGKTPEEIYNTAVMIGDKLGNIANESFPDFCVRAFRVKPEYSKMIKCEREIIGKRGIFVTKKRYVAKVVNLDGYRVDKLKAMGLEMKKTTTPKAFQEFTQRVVNLILDGEMDWDDIDDIIIDFREKMVNDMPIFEIGLPKGVKGVDEYTAEHERCNKLELKARLPGHVAASIHYNECLKQFKDTNSMPIVSGTKIKVFYLKKPRGRFTSIAVPTDLGKLPSWMIENPEFAVDVSKHETKLIDGILEKIFTVLHREVATAQTKFNNSLMEW